MKWYKVLLCLGIKEVKWIRLVSKPKMQRCISLGELAIDILEMITYDTDTIWTGQMLKSHVIVQL